MKGTTIVAVKRNGQVAVAGDGQVTLSEKTIVKTTATKVRRIYKGRVIVGFAGAVADAMTLFDKFETHLEGSRGQLSKAAVALAKEWRSDRVLRRLDALLLAADENNLLLISGTGELLEPDDGVIGIGSGGTLAMAAARALFQHTNLGAQDIATAAMNVAADLCVFTNHEIVVETLGGDDDGQ